MTQLHFGPRRDLVLDIDKEPVGIQQGAGLHRFLLPFKILGVSNTPEGIPLSISGSAWLTVTGMEWLGTWTTERPLVTRTSEDYQHIVLPLSDDQLAKVEKLRAGREVRMQIDADVVMYDPDGLAQPSPDRWPVKSFRHDLFSSMPIPGSG
jgi:hypothetical protein